MFSGTIKSLILSMRPKQWIKNTFVFSGLVFSGNFLDINSVFKVLSVCIMFCLVSGGIYIINDLIDKDKDVLHPEKCKRPIASGRVSFASALVLCTLLLLSVFALSLMLGITLFIVFFSYFALMLGYSLFLKNFVIIDVIVIAAGFVLRVVAGGVVIGVSISPWLIICTALLALFLGLHKRKNEISVLSDNAPMHRANLVQYTPELIDTMLSTVTSATLMSYLLYTFTAGKSSYMMITIPFVVYGIFRYQYITIAKNCGGSPEHAVLNDKPLLIDILLWAAACMVIVVFCR